MKMTEFTASNGLRIERDDDAVRIHHGYGFLDHHAISAAEAQALREFFQHERDAELGRWRWPENPDYVVYQADSGRVRVLRESDGKSGVWSRAQKNDGWMFAQPAIAYFDAHPETKPWHDAQEGEVWVITVRGEEYPAIFQADAFRDGGGSWAMEDITAGRRIYPEVSA